MTLTFAEIQKIETFVKSKYVEYYDIQVELVDHLASAIETELEQYPNQDFEKVLLSQYKNFGLFGFSDFVTERAKATYSQSRKKYWRQFFEYFKLQKFVYTILFFILTLLLVSNLKSDQYKYFVLPYLVTIALTAAVIFYKLKAEEKLKLLQKKYQPLWISMSGSLLNLNNLLLSENLRNEIFGNPIFVAALCTFVTIGTWSELSTHKQIHEKLRYQYPEAFK
jgi:thiosulfate reductase cytochrome b subunit